MCLAVERSLSPMQPTNEANRYPMDAAVKGIAAQAQRFQRRRHSHTASLLMLIGIQYVDACGRHGLGNAAVGCAATGRRRRSRRTPRRAASHYPSAMLLARIYVTPDGLPILLGTDVDHRFYN